MAAVDFGTALHAMPAFGWLHNRLCRAKLVENSRLFCVFVLRWLLGASMGAVGRVGMFSCDKRGGNDQRRPHLSESCQIC